MDNYVYIVIECTYDIPFKIKEVFSSEKQAKDFVCQESTYSRLPLHIVPKELNPYFHKYKSAYIVFSKDGQKQVKVDNYQSKRKTTIRKVQEGWGIEIPMHTGDTTEEAVKKAEELIRYVLTHKNEFDLIQERCVEESYFTSDGYDDALHSRTRLATRKLYPIYDAETKEILLDRNERIIKL